jgi:hypothetical protein
MANREKMILELTQSDLDWFFESGDAKAALTDILMNGFPGFNNLDDQVLIQELRYREMEIPE